MNERRESIDEKEQEEHDNELVAQKKLSIGSSAKRQTSVGRNDHGHPPQKSLTAQSVLYLEGQRKPTLIPPKT